MTEFAWQSLAAATHRLSWMKVNHVIARMPDGTNESESEIRAIRVRACLPWAIGKMIPRLWARGHTVTGVPINDRDAAIRLINKIAQTERFLIEQGASRIEWQPKTAIVRD